MPSDAVGPPERSSALPMATTVWPTLSDALSPIGTGVSPEASTLTTARSSVWSMPTTLASFVEPSSKVTLTVVAPSTT